MAAILRVKDENGNIVSIPAIKGEKGDKGDRGLPGSGGVPDGGTTGQVLTKNSNADGDAVWKNSSGAEFSDDGSGNISVNGASSDAKRFLNSLTVPGLNYKYVNPINSGTYASPYGVYISSGTVIDYVVGLTQVGFYTAYVNRKVTDIPDAAKAANSSLRGFVCVSQIDNTASGGSTKCYAYIVLIDQNSNFYIQYIQGSVGGGWKRMYPYETAESTFMEKLDKNQGTANSGKFLGIGADGVVVPTDVGGGSSKNYRKIAEVTISEEINNIVINKDVNGNPFEITEYFVYGTDVKATGATQICTSFNTTSTYSWGWTGINGFIDATTAKNIYMESIWIGRRILRLNSSQWNNGTLSVMHKPNNDQYGNVEKISGINLIAITYPFSQGTISVWGG